MHKVGDIVKVVSKSCGFPISESPENIRDIDEILVVCSSANNTYYILKGNTGCFRKEDLILQNHQERLNRKYRRNYEKT